LINISNKEIGVKKIWGKKYIKVKYKCTINFDRENYLPFSEVSELYVV